ncbi:MAG TPA: HD domain-containing phosphohydrolase [Opitutus sp.]|nr:HD domain-containing phosphohydrolase [Opitutus sp.]
MNAPPAILIVDDESIVLDSLRQTLERDGHAVVACLDPLKALALVNERDFAVIISDYKMPAMTGLEFLIESRRLRPNASRILITAILSLSTIVEAINRGEIFRFVAKPWLREELLVTVRNALQRYDLVTSNEQLQAETLRLNEELTVANASLEQRVRDLEEQRQKLDAANHSLATRYDNSLELTRRILSAFDPVLGGQTRALVEIAGKMAATEYFDDTHRRALRTAAGLCDLGLIGVPRELLRSFRTRPEHLAEHERAMLHHHPVYSQTLAALVDDSPEVGEAIRAHHERFDGYGFPDGLAENHIPWTARCLAVAVGFVECGLPRAAALEFVQSRAGTRFDPEAVRLFLKVMQLIHLPRQVREILLDDLKPGMVLASGIYSPHGLLLIGEGQSLDAAVISKIRSHNRVAPISQRLLVYS